MMLRPVSRLNRSLLEMNRPLNRFVSRSNSIIFRSLSSVHETPYKTGSSIAIAAASNGSKSARRTQRRGDKMEHVARHSKKEERMWPFIPGTEVTLEITSLTNLGRGVARLPLPSTPVSPLLQETSSEVEITGERTEIITNVEGNASWVIFVDDVIPGETVTATISRNSPSFSEAALKEVIKSSPNRVTPICPFVGQCGGCQYQHMDINTQHNWKRRHVVEALTRVGKFDESYVNELVSPVRGTEQIFGYRRKLSPAYDPHRSINAGVREGRYVAVGEGKRFGRSHGPMPKLGPLQSLSPAGVKAAADAGLSSEDVTEYVYRVGTHRTGSVLLPHGWNENITFGYMRRDCSGTVHVPRCPLGTDNINAVMEKHQNDLRQQLVTSVPPTGVSLIYREVNGGYVGTTHREVVTEVVLGKSFQFRAGEFFQVNPYVLEVLAKFVLDKACAPLSGSNPQPPKYLVDAYCGSGLFAILAAEHFQKVYGVEISEVAIDCARNNAKLNNIKNVKFLAGAAEHIFATLPADLPSEESVMIIDPPRKGCDDQFLSQLFKLGPRRLVYIACDHITQARDARKLVDGGYKILEVVPFDMFPQTRHIENVILFEKSSD